MKYRKVTAIINSERLEVVEEALEACDVPGITVTRVKGYGDYKNFFAHDWMASHVRLEIFLLAEQAHAAKLAIAKAARSGDVGDGIVVVSSIEDVYCIREEKSL